MEIVFIRHGESEANCEGLIQGRGDYPLSERGRAQAERTARALADFGAEIIFTSPLERARTTAQIIGRGRARLRELTDLVEYDLGAFEGLSFAQVCERFPTVPEKLRRGVPFHHLAPGAESDEQADQRAARAVELIIAANCERVIVVSHLGILERVIMMMVGKFGITAPAADWPLKNCSITRLRLDAEGAALAAINEVAHLEPGV